MKMKRSLFGVAAVAATSTATAEDATPVTKVLQLMSDLQARLISEGQSAQKVYTEAAEWCEDRSKDLQYQIKTGKAESAELTAEIEKQTANLGALNAKVEELTAAMADGEANLKEMTAVREKEAKDFAGEQEELNDIISMLKRAIGILERDAQKSGGAAMLQTKSTDSVAQALSVLVDASGFRSADVSKLTALVQSSQSSKAQDQDEDQEEGLGAPAGAVYEDRSGSIIQTMEELLEKAQGQLSDATAAETKSRNNYAMMKQSIEDENGFGSNDLATAKKGLSTSAGKKSVATGDLASTTKALKEDETALADLHQDCVTKAQDYEAEVKSRNEEMKAITKAKSIVADATGGAADNSYGDDDDAASFLQVGHKNKHKVQFHVVREIRDLAMKDQSKSLMQLSHKIAGVLAAGNKFGADPFQKVKGLIVDMISKLEDDADAAATHKAYCDKEMKETKEKDDDKTDEIESLSTKIDQMTSAAAKLRQQIRFTQKALASLAKSQAEMDKIRQEENTVFVKTKSDLEQGLDGVQRALKVLRDYYSAGDKDHAAATGAGAGIIGLLEVIESDFTQGLAECNAAEEAAVSAYDKETKENEIEVASKQSDVKYKSQEVTSLEKATSDATTDRTGVQSELDAVKEYMASLQKQCVAKPDSYEERTRRREAEIAGLKDALSSLEGQSLLQSGSSRHVRRNLRTTA